MGNLAALVLTLCSVPVPELLLHFCIGEDRSEPLHIGTVASAGQCEFNQALVGSFSKASRLSADVARFLLTVLLLRKGEFGFCLGLGFFILGGEGCGGRGGERSRETRSRLARALPFRTNHWKLL